MSKQQPTDTLARGAQSSIHSPSIDNQQTPEVKTEETETSNLVLKLTTRVELSKGKEAPPPEASESADDKLAGFKSKNPDLYPPTKEAQKKASLETPEPLARTGTLSKAQRELERLMNPRVLDPTPIKEVEEQDKARETMRQSKAKRFQRFVEEYMVSGVDQEGTCRSSY